MRAQRKAPLPRSPVEVCAIHATALVIEEAGVVIRGRSGTGKSSIALALLRLAERDGRFARLIGDDRVHLVSLHGRVIVAGHPAIAGLIERRGVGILDVPHEPRGVVRLVVDLVASDDPCGVPPRMPRSADRHTQIAATELPRLVLPAHGSAEAAAAQILGSLSG